MVRTLYIEWAKEAIHLLKFERNQSIATALGQSLADFCPTGIITYAPTVNRRVRQRGYDQAQLMARSVAAATGNPYRRLLSRRGSQRQLGQKRARRQVQLQGAFSAIVTGIPRSTPIILIDDVLTTGSTLEAAASALHQIGYEQLHAMAFAWVAPEDYKL